MPVRIQRVPFDAGAELSALTAGRDDIGASVTFVGQVRRAGETGAIEAMELEHYPAMAARALADIEAEARARFAITDILIVHRYGELRPGDPIVLVIATARSRGPAFEAAAFAMDILKTSAPFWKKERGSDGARWVEARHSDEKAAGRWAHPPAGARPSPPDEPA